MVARLTFSEAIDRKGAVNFQLKFTGVDGLINCVADSEAHRDEIIRRQPRRRWCVDNNGLKTGFTVSFCKKFDLTLGHSIPAVLHGLEYQNATRINSDMGDFREANFKKVK